MRKNSIVLIIVFTVLTFNNSANLWAQTSDSDASVANDEVKMKIRDRKGRPDIPGTMLIEFGFNILQDAPSSMDLSFLGSRTVNIYYFHDINIGNSGLVFMPGVGVGLNHYKFDNDVTLADGTNADGDTFTSVVDISDRDVKKSLLANNFLDIPLELRFYTNPDDKKRSFNFGVGVKGGIRFSSHTKVKFKENSENVKFKDKRSFELNRFRYGITGRIGIGGFNVFYYHGLSEMFDGNGPEGTKNTTDMTIGLSFTAF